MVFAGDRRVWRVAGIVAIPLIALIAFHSLRPRFYTLGSDSVNETTFIGPVAAGVAVCTPAVLELPAGTTIVRLRVRSPTRVRPPLALTLRTGAATVHSSLPPLRVTPDRISNADFVIPTMPSQPAARYAAVCASGTERGLEWVGAAVPSIVPQSVTVGGTPLGAELASWFLPEAGARRSYASEAWSIFRRAAMFRAGFVGAWTYVLILFVVLPLLALLAVRTLAQSLQHGIGARRTALFLFAIAAVNFACWALITPPWQAPDEVDHFAYTQSVVERGEGPAVSAATPLNRWSDEESLALEATAFMTDHEVADTGLPWTPLATERLHRLNALQHPAGNDGGGYTTSAAHGPLYYLALAPGYMLAPHGSAFSQLTLMRFTSALLGAVAVLCAFLLARELVPQRPWLGVLAALLVTYEPMYGFMSGAVNNDVGVNVGAAVIAYLLVRLLRRGMTVPWGLFTGIVIVATPLAKETGLSLYPVVAIALLGGLWRRHSRSDLPGWLALIGGALAMNEISTHVLSLWQPPAGSSGFRALGANSSAASLALHHIPEFISYLWQMFLPRLPFMGQHFATGGVPAYAIFVKRGFGAFGWYDVFFPNWIYLLIVTGMLAAIPLGAWTVRREWGWLRRNWLEALVVLMIPIAVIAGFEAAYYSPGVQSILPTYGRYAFPAIVPLALIVVGVLHAFGRRALPYCGVALVIVMVALSYGAQLLTLTSFYG
jgi:Dolichyl-phosphate-mannose-protein mannosyltransferase